MRKAIVWGVVLLCAAVLLPLGVTGAQRMREEPVSLGAEVLAQRALTALIQEEVSGSGGNKSLRVSLEGAIALLPPERAQFVGTTSATFTPGAATTLVLNRGCHAEFPGTHACSFNDLVGSQPPPPEWPGSLILQSPFGFGGECFNSSGLFVDCGTSAHPTACCSGPVDD